MTPEAFVEMKNDIKDIKCILTGNGAPIEGLVFKVERNANFIRFWERFWWICLTAAIGVPFSAAVILVAHYVNTGVPGG